MHVFHPFTNNAANNNDNNTTNVFWSFIIDETCSYILFSQGIVVPCVSHESAGIYCYRVDVYTVKLIREKFYCEQYHEWSLSHILFFGASSFMKPMILSQGTVVPCVLCCRYIYRGYKVDVL